MKRSRKMVALFSCLAVLLSLLPISALADGGPNYGDRYDHIDVKVDSEYTFTVDGIPTTVNGVIQPDTMVVKIGSQTYDLSKYNVRTQSEDSQTEYEIRTSLSPDNIEWVKGTYKMSNVTVSGRMLFSDVPASLKDLLPTTNYNGKTYYYTDFTDYKYTGLQECTGGWGMRSKGNSGTPTGLDLYIAADGLDILLTEGKIAIEKVIVDESGEELTDSTSFSYALTSILRAMNIPPIPRFGGGGQQHRHRQGRRNGCVGRCARRHIPDYRNPESRLHHPGNQRKQDNRIYYGLCRENKAGRRYSRCRFH